MIILQMHHVFLLLFPEDAPHVLGLMEPGPSLSFVLKGDHVLALSTVGVHLSDDGVELVNLLHVVRVINVAITNLRKGN